MSPKQHTAQFTVQDNATATTFALSGATPDAAICKGDAAGPAPRTANGHPELVRCWTSTWWGGVATSTGSRR